MTRRRYELSVKDAGVFKPNRTRPIHRWYPFVEGYSSELVDWAIGETRVNAPRVLDPFGGSGTTALAVAEHNLDSWYCEVNPFLAWLADVKINQVQLIKDEAMLAPLLKLRNLLETARKTPRVGRLSANGLVAVERKRQFFPKGVAAQVVNTLDWLDHYAHGPVRELGRAAVAVSLVPSSYMIRRTDLRRRTNGDPKPIAFADCLVRALNEIIEDANPSNRRWSSRGTKVAGDMRSLVAPPDVKFDLIVTSPPYLNGTNYCRNTKLEMIALGFISDESGLAKSRLESITAGINNVSGRRSVPEEIEEVEQIARKLDISTYDRRIPQLVRLYFSDMRAGLIALRSAASENANFFLDIGDSRFAGVHIPTDELLVKVAEQVGWTHVESFLVRERRSFDGSRLTQVILRLEADG